MLGQYEHQCTGRLKLRINNDFFPNRHLTHVTSEKDTNTILKDIVTLMISVRIYQANHNICMKILINMFWRYRR